MYVLKYIWIRKILFKNVPQNPPDFCNITFLTTNRTGRLNTMFIMSNIALF